MKKLKGLFTKIIDSADTWLPERLKRKFRRANTYAKLVSAEDNKRRIINGQHMAAGVRMIDPATVYIDVDVEIEEGSVIYPSVILEGKCRIGKNTVLGPNTHLVNTIVGDECRVRQSVAENVQIGSSTTVGPFAYLRENADIGDNCRIGNFVEIKNSILGSGVKMAHLAYMGDADVGADVNYSCGAITCNYDGKKKYRTTIEDGAFIGSNSNLLAPVTIGKNSYVAAGSTITDDVDEDALAIARGRQVQKDGWIKK